MVFFNKPYWDKQISTCERVKSDPHFTPSLTKTSSKDQRPSVRLKNIKLLEENIGVNLCDLGLGNSLLDMTPKAQVTLEKID